MYNNQMYRTVSILLFLLNSAWNENWPYFLNALIIDFIDFTVNDSSIYVFCFIFLFLFLHCHFQSTHSSIHLPMKWQICPIILIELIFLHSTTILHSNVLPSNQKPMDRTNSLSYRFCYLFILFFYFFDNLYQSDWCQRRKDLSQLP